jgi:hypothetical protein
LDFRGVEAGRRPQPVGRDERCEGRGTLGLCFCACWNSDAARAIVPVVNEGGGVERMRC